MMRAMTTKATADENQAKPARPSREIFPDFPIKRRAIRVESSRRRLLLKVGMAAKVVDADEIGTVMEGGGMTTVMITKMIAFTTTTTVATIVTKTTTDDEAGAENTATTVLQDGKNPGRNPDRNPNCDPRNPVYSCAAQWMSRKK